MAAILGEHYIICAICQKKIYASTARKHYLGFWTCPRCWEEYPVVLRPLPKPREQRPVYPIQGPTDDLPEEAWWNQRWVIDHYEDIID